MGILLFIAVLALIGYALYADGDKNRNRRRRAPARMVASSHGSAGPLVHPDTVNTALYIADVAGSVLPEERGCAGVPAVEPDGTSDYSQCEPACTDSGADFGSDSSCDCDCGSSSTDPS